MKTNKKQGISLIVLIGIIAVVLILITVLVLALTGGKGTSNVETENKSNSIFGNKGTTITSEDISKYDLETDTIWINRALGITYNIPKKVGDTSFRGSSSFAYLHGASFSYYTGISTYYGKLSVYVDKSLEGNKNLETLASDIIKEKQSYKYKFIYDFGSEFQKEFNNIATENVKIGAFNTVYFESETITTKSAFGDELKAKIIGYSFEYNGEYISVYGELLDEGEATKLTELKTMLQYIISSINVYNGESLVELGGNAKNYYGDGFLTNDVWSTSGTYITMNFIPSNVQAAGIFASENLEGFCRQLKSDKIDLKDNTIEELTKAAEKDASHVYYSWVNETYDTGKKGYVTMYDVLKEEKIKINNIDVNKYLIKTYYNTEKTAGKIIFVYIFEIAGEDYMCQYSLNSNIYDDKKISEMSQQEEQLIIKQTEIAADTMMSTLRILDENFKTMDSMEQYSEYTKYINY